MEVDPTNIWIWQAGYYYVSYSVYHQEACQMSLFKNSTLLPGTIVGSPTGASVNASVYIVELLDSDISEQFAGAPS